MSFYIKSSARCLSANRRCFGYSYKAGARHPHVCNFVHHRCSAQVIAVRSDMLEFELKEYHPVINV